MLIKQYRISNTEIKTQIDIIYKIESKITEAEEKSFLKEVINNNNDLFINSDNMIFQIAAINNQIIEENYNDIPTIYLDKCEKILKDNII